MTEGGDSRGAIAVATDAPDADEAGRIALDVVHDGGAWTDLDTFEARAAAAARAVAARCCAGSGPLAAALALSSDTRVQTLNRDYRGFDKPTNVLSFPADADHLPPEGPRWLGDIVIAEETLVREADERGIAVLDHFSHLTVHGLMHLLGFDHETETEAVVMEAHETAILAALGVADPYLEEETVGPTG